MNTSNAPVTHDPTYWFDRASQERVATARRVSHKLRFAGRLEDHLNESFLRPLESVVRRDGLHLVEFTPGGLRIGGKVEKDIIEFRFVVEQTIRENEMEIRLLKITADNAKAVSHWVIERPVINIHGRSESVWDIDAVVNNGRLKESIAQTTGTAVSDATYQQETA